MRFVPILMLALLMLGFASRPTVSAALTDGHIMLHPFMTVAAADTSQSVEQDGDHKSDVHLVKCASLGVLPSGFVLATWPRTQQFVRIAPVSMSLRQSYSILRPPRAAA